MSEPFVQATLALFALWIAWTLWSDRRVIARKLSVFWSLTERPRELASQVGWLYTTFILICSPIWLTIFVIVLLGLLNTILAIPDAIADDDPLAIRFVLITITALTATLGALVAFPFTVLRTQYNARQTEATEQGLITERITKAVEQLGAEKTVNGFRREVVVTWPGGETTNKSEFSTQLDWTVEKDAPEFDPDLEVKEGRWEPAVATVPNLEVRIGAIYALERIAQDSERDHIQIMEILCAYIRSNAPASMAQDHGLGDWEPSDDWTWEEREKRFEERSYNLDAWLETLEGPRTDIQTALEVIGRRDTKRINGIEAKPHGGQERYKLDFRKTCLRLADLSHLSFSHAQFTGAWMDRADLKRARMEGAKLLDARLEGAVLYEARMERAILRWAQVEGANLSLARMEGVDLSKALMAHADLSEARMEEVNLSEASMEGAFLYGTRMERAYLFGARIGPSEYFIPASLKGAGFKEIDLSSLSFNPDTLAAAFGDASVILPDGPQAGQSPFDHWSEDVLEWQEFQEKWKAWRSKLDPN